MGHCTQQIVDSLVENRIGYLVTFALKGQETFLTATKHIDVFGMCAFVCACLVI